MTRIVTTAYRYKRPAKKRKAVALAGPVVITKRGTAGLPAGGKTKPEPAAPPPPANDDSQPPPPSARKPAITNSISRKRARFQNGTIATAEPDPEAASVNPSGGKNAAIVTARRPGARRVDVPDLTPEEYQRRGDAADALWRELVRRATGKDDRPG